VRAWSRECQHAGKKRRREDKENKVLLLGA